MNVFTGDGDLQALQREDLRADIVKGVPIDNVEARREYLANARELREQARWRSIAYLAFVLPVVFALLSMLAQWAVAHFMMPTP